MSELKGCPLGDGFKRIFLLRAFSFKRKPLFKRGARQGALLGAEGAEAAKPRAFGRGDCYAILSPIGFFKLNEILDWPQIFMI